MDQVKRLQMLVPDICTLVYLAKESCVQSNLDPTNSVHVLCELHRLCSVLVSADLETIRPPFVPTSNAANSAVSVLTRMEHLGRELEARRTTLQSIAAETDRICALVELKYTSSLERLSDMTGVGASPSEYESSQEMKTLFAEMKQAAMQDLEKKKQEQSSQNSEDSPKAVLHPREEEGEYSDESFADTDDDGSLASEETEPSSTSAFAVYFQNNNVHTQANNVVNVHTQANNVIRSAASQPIPWFLPS